MAQFLLPLVVNDLFVLKLSKAHVDLLVIKFSFTVQIKSFGIGV
jgi:hypothetical protein